MKEGGKAKIYGDGKEEQKRRREEGQVSEGRIAAATAAAREVALILQPLI